MGLHAFAEEPQHCALYRSFVGPRLPRLRGLVERWNMPAVRHRTDLGRGATFTGVDHYVLTYQLGGADTRRLDRPGVGGVARRGALSLQQPGSVGTFASAGPVDYVHFYFRQSLICEVAEESGLSARAEPHDFFAAFDPTLARDAQTYFRRAEDRRDPATALEMDQRAYLLALGLLYALARRDGRGAETERVSRADLRRVLREIEEGLAEPLRLSDLAAKAGISPFHFIRVFKAELGESPARYVMRKRTERALDMIRASDEPLADIAYRTGFSSQAHMTRRIREATGTTPGRLRAAHRRP